MDRRHAGPVSDNLREMFRRSTWLLCAFFACAPSSAPPPATQPVDDVSDDAGVDAGVEAPLDAGRETTDAGTDADHDGLDDRYEDELARGYLPYLSLDPNDKCPLSGILFRARPHPQNPALVHILYDRLYQRDCGLGGHLGDDEAFAITVDPRQPYPFGLTAMKAISHQGTACQRVSECDRCGGSACDLASVGTQLLPVVFSSSDKHGTYVLRSTCQLSCLDNCVLAPTAFVPPLQNAGEPGAPLTHDLSANGFITAANGWTETALFGFDPWAAGVSFGGAGVVASDLVDPAFDTKACAAP